ncbi:MAG: hypothetical protein AABZ44_01815, partial [Elusimicrobiota bacterium]
GHDLYSEENYDIDVIRKHLGEFPLIGMFSSFEVAGQQGCVSTQEGSVLANGFCGVLTVFEERN